jgi:MFS family permease
MLWSQAGKYQIPLFCCLQNTPPTAVGASLKTLTLTLTLSQNLNTDSWIRGQSVQGGITASMPGGSWLGALISGYLSDILGRRKAIQVGSVIWCIGSILVCASQNIGMLVVGRFINGLSVGICSAQVPVYITEIAPPSKRGRLVGCQQCE